MANIKSAEKRNRQRIKRRARNLHHLTTMRTTVKKLRVALDGKDAKAADILKAAISLIDRTAQKGVIKKETAARKISRLVKAHARTTAAAQ